MAVDRRIGCGGEQTYDPLLMWDDAQYLPRRGYMNELECCYSWSVSNDEGRTRRGQTRTGRKLREARIPLLHFQLGL